MTKKSQQNNRCGSVVGIIPARYASQRFPGKMLALISGKSLIQRTYENALRCPHLNDVVVATDDDRIYQHVVSFGGTAVMTSINCPTGTDRLVEALGKLLQLDDAEIIVNIQGDEPCVHPEVISQVVTSLQNDISASMSTAALRLESAAEAHNPSVVKCVIDGNNNALYFSRALIPAGHAQQWRPDIPVYRHVGIYGFRRELLLKYADIPQTPLQIAEDLEQLKVLENGHRIKVAVVKHRSIDVNLPEDIKKVEEWLCKQNTYL